MKKHQRWHTSTRTDERNIIQFWHPALLPILTILLLIFSSCAEKDPVYSGSLKHEILRALNGKILYRNSADHIILKEFHGRSRTIGISTVSGAKWSPDGTRFSFVETMNNIPYLSIFDRKGDKINSWELSGIPQSELKGLTWSPDGKYNALLKSGHQVVCVEVETGTSSIFSLDPGKTYTSLAWCPSNHKIAVSEGRSIWLVDAFVNQPPSTLLVSDEEPDTIMAMDWNSDGSLLAFSGGLADSKVKVVDVQGENCTTLQDQEEGTSMPILGVAPCWYSDGEQIMFVHLNHGKVYWNIGLYLTDLKKEYEVDLNIPGYDPDCS